MTARGMKKSRWRWVVLGAAVMFLGLFPLSLARANDFLEERDFSFNVPLRVVLNKNFLSTNNLIVKEGQGYDVIEDIGYTGEYVLGTMRQYGYINRRILLL